MDNNKNLSVSTKKSILRVIATTILGSLMIFGICILIGIILDYKKPVKSEVVIKAPQPKIHKPPIKHFWDLYPRTYSYLLKQKSIYIDETTFKEIVDYIYREYTEPYNKLLLAIAIVETNFNYLGVNYRKYAKALKYVNPNTGQIINNNYLIAYKRLAIGIMQIKPYYWFKVFKKKGYVNTISDFFNYKKNIKMCYEILKQQGIDKNPFDALIKYNKDPATTYKIFRILGMIEFFMDLDKHKT